MRVRSSDGTRCAWMAIVLLVVSLPHALEDFAFDEPAKVGVPTSIAMSALLAIYAAQLAGAWLAFRGNPWGGRVIAAAGILWFAGALSIHGPEIRVEGLMWRFGVTSVVQALLVVVAGASAIWYGSIASQSGSRSV